MTSSSEQTKSPRDIIAAEAALWYVFETPEIDDYNFADSVLAKLAPRVVSTVAELDALPRDSIIHVPGGSASARKCGDGLWSCDYGFHQGKVPSTTFLNQDGNLIGVVVLWVGGTE